MIQDFQVGDYVQILTKDGATFKGVLQDFDPNAPVPWFKLNGYGFPFEDVVAMEAA